ncbi:hypothetical protein P9112_002297 [Eukaryota sp. TZLM1-RC]
MSEVDLATDVTTSINVDHSSMSDQQFLDMSLSEAALVRNLYSTSYESLFHRFYGRTPRVIHNRHALPASSFPLSHYNKPSPWQFYKSIGSPRTFLAPMVRGSELAFRLLTKRYGTHIATSPMLSARGWLTSQNNQDMILTTNTDDTPLIIQVAGHDPALVCLTAMKALSIAPHAVAIELNCGCPMRVARRGYYGCHLQDNWPLIQTILASLNQCVKVPVIVKIRRQSTIEDTIAYAQALVDSGALMVTIHCRTREQRGTNKGTADWTFATSLVNALNVPIVLNGGIDHYRDVHDVVSTGCAGFMSGEGLLNDPSLFFAFKDNNNKLDDSPTFTQLALELVGISNTISEAMLTQGTLKSHLVQILGTYLTPDGLKDATKLVVEGGLDRNVIFRDSKGWIPSRAYKDLLEVIMNSRNNEVVVDGILELRRRLDNQIDGCGNQKSEVIEEVSFEGMEGLFLC